jgi:hypothetical protein
MIASVMENPTITIEKLNEINSKMDNNTAVVKDYEDLSYFLSRFKMNDYVLDNMKNFGFYNYQEFIDYRRKPSNLKSLSFEEGIILGIIKESISILKNSLSAKNI